MNQIEAMKQALEAFEQGLGHLARDTLRAAIEQAMGPGEPCNHERVDEDLITGSWSFCKHCHKEWTSDMGNTAPQPQREWVGLTDEDIDSSLSDPSIAEIHQGNWLVLPYAFTRAMEAKLREKNAPESKVN
jgi:hypothetical protein